MRFIIGLIFELKQWVIDYKLEICASSNERHKYIEILQFSSPANAWMTGCDTSKAEKISIVIITV